MKVTWNSIKISGQKEAMVAICQGREIGTISKVATGSAWVAYAGIGNAAKFIGKKHDKRAAKVMLVHAPESFWRKDS